MSTVSTEQQTPPIPAGPFNGTPEELVAAGELIKELLDHPGYKALVGATNAHAEQLRLVLERGKPSDSAAHYADLVGEQRGLRSVDAIARGFVLSADQARQQLQTREDG